MGEKMTLLPCPFCGSEARLGKFDIPAVECSDEECGASLHRYHRGDAYKLWNTRATPAQTVDVAKMRNELLKGIGGYLERHHPDSAISYDAMTDYVADKLSQAIGDKT